MQVFTGRKSQQEVKKTRISKNNNQKKNPPTDYPKISNIFYGINIPTTYNGEKWIKMNIIIIKKKIDWK